MRLPVAADKTHIEVATIARRNVFPLGLRKWGMRITVTDDPTPANNISYRLKKNLVDDDKSNNANWEDESTGGGSGTAIPITEDYADIATMLADQAAQVTGQWYRALDASDDDDVDNGWAVYEKLAATTGTLADYYLILDQESLGLLQSPTTNINAATLRGCGTTPVSLVSAPGVNKFIAPEKLVFSYKAGATAFNFTGDLHIKTTGGDVLFVIPAEVINSLTSGNFCPVMQGQKVATNQALLLTTSDSLDATLGDGDLDIKTYRTIEDANT